MPKFVYGNIWLIYVDKALDNKKRVNNSCEITYTKVVGKGGSTQVW